MATEPKKSSNRIILIIGLVAAALAFGGVLYILRQGGGGPTRTVVVARSDIQAGAVLSADSVRSADLPADSTPADAVTDPAAVAGKIAGASISANTPIVPALFEPASGTAPVPAPAAGSSSSSSSSSSTPSRLAIDKGQVALAIPAVIPNADYATGEQLSVGYYIQPGDHIDILIDPGQPNGSPAGIRYSFQDVPVLRAGSGTGTASGGAAPAPTVYVVELPRAQAEMLTAILSHRGPAVVVKYVLRAPEDYGKPGTPNYQDSGPASVPVKQDQTVAGDVLSRNFPR